MRTFIYSYEACLLDYLNSIIPDVKEITYANREDMFAAMSSVKRYPAVYYNRSEGDKWTLPRKYDFADVSVINEGEGVELIKSSACVIEQHYTMRIYVENVAKALSLSSLIKFKWTHYLDVKWEFTKEFLYNNVKTDKTHRVGMYLLGVNVGEDRSPNDKIGSQRYVDVQWTCQLFQWFTDKERDTDNLVESVHFFVGDKDIIMRDGLINQGYAFAIV